MIISDEYKFCFIHIPKCAGSTVHAELERYDSRHNYYFLTKEKLKPGVIDRTHLTPSLLRYYYPDDFKLACEYTSFAVLREPHDRFLSSFKQFLHINDKKPLAELSVSEMHKELDELIAALMQDVELNPRYVHFTRQVEFVYFEGQRFVDRLYSVTELETLYKHIARMIGRPLARTPPGIYGEKKNASRVYRNELMRRTSRGVRPYVARCLPKSIKKRLQPLFFVSPSNRKFAAFESDYVREFVNGYYLKDIEMYDRFKSAKL